MRPGRLGPGRLDELDHQGDDQSGFNEAGAIRPRKVNQSLEQINQRLDELQ